MRKICKKNYKKKKKKTTSLRDWFSLKVIYIKVINYYNDNFTLKYALIIYEIIFVFMTV
jgi:hypothetical protein